MLKRKPEDGSALALVPAGFLVLILLAALAVDSAAAYLGQQQLHDSLSAAANDAVAAAVDNRAFYTRGVVAVDAGQAARVVCTSMAAQKTSQLRSVRLSMRLAGVSLELQASATVDMVFGRALPGLGRRTVSSRAAAVLDRGPSLPASSGGSAGWAPLQC